MALNWVASRADRRVPVPVEAAVKASANSVKVLLISGPHWKLVFTRLAPCEKTFQMFWPP